MIRMPNLLVVASLSLLAFTVACPQPVSKGEGEGEGEGENVGEGEGEPPPATTVTVQSSNNALPPAWVASSIADLKSDDTSATAAVGYAQLVTISAANMSVNQTPCPLPFTSSSGQTFCDGLNLTDGTSTAILDTFSFLGKAPACTVPTTGSLATVTGLWSDKFDPTAHTETWVLSIVDCAGIGLGTAYAGTGVAPSSTDVHDFMTNFTANTSVTLKGVVTAKFTGSTGSFGFSLQDPAGGPNSGIMVIRGKASTTTAVAPAVGDYVTVTGTSAADGAIAHTIKL